MKSDVTRERLAVPASAQRTRALPILAMALGACHLCYGHSIQSPDGRVRLQTGLVRDGEKSLLQFSVSFEGTPIVSNSSISFISDDGPIGAHLRSQGRARFDAQQDVWKPVYGERSTVVDQYNQLRLDFVDEASGHELEVEFRCYDAGVAFKTVLIAPDADSRIRITHEHSEFRFLGDHTAWCAAAPQAEHREQRLSEIRGGVERPLTLKLDDQVYAAIAEAGLVDYAVMHLRPATLDPYCLVSQLGSDVQSAGRLQTPWRVLLVGRSPGELLENNDMLLNLSAPCAIADTSWIKPGKVIRDVTLSTKGATACVDFAVRHGLQYIELDAGWYGPENDDASDATTVTVDENRSDGPLDLPFVIDYAAKRGIGVILYVNRRALETQLDHILPLYKRWGVKGVKYGFVQTGSQRWTAWLHQAVRKAAEHQLMVDVHDNYRPTGYSRTYPNLMTQEGVLGDEATPTSSQAIITLFTRNLAGAADHTICYLDPRVERNWTHGHQLAKAVCTYSPWQFLFWYDNPLALHRKLERPELEFFSQLPTVWDETRVVLGDIGNYVVIARRSGHDWFLGAMNAGEARELTVSLNFLDSAHRYQAQIFGDGPAGDASTRVQVVEKCVDAKTRLNLSMQPNAGYAIRLTPAEPVMAAAQAPRQPPLTVSARSEEHVD